MSYEEIPVKPWSVKANPAAQRKFFSDPFVSVVVKQAREAKCTVEAIPYQYPGAKGAVYTTRILIEGRVCSLHRLGQIVYRGDEYHLPYWQAQLVQSTLRKVHGVIICTAKESVVVCTSAFLVEKAFAPNPNVPRKNIYLPDGHAVWADSIGRDLLKCTNAFHLLAPEVQQQTA